MELTKRGQRFLDEARQLLAIAQRMQERPRADLVRIAHIYELDTSRDVADAFSRACPGIQLVERAMDSISPGDPEQATASLYERPFEVFGDTRESGLYNAHGNYLSALEQYTGLAMRWLGTPPASSHCLAHVLRATGSATILEFSSYAERYAAAGLPVYRPAELQPYYPWSLAWRSEEPDQATPDLLHIALEVALRRGWLQPSIDTDAPAWLLPDDPAAEQLAITRSGQSDDRVYLDQQACR